MKHHQVFNFIWEEMCFSSETKYLQAFFKMTCFIDSHNSWKQCNQRKHFTAYVLIVLLEKIIKNSLGFVLHLDLTRPMASALFLGVWNPRQSTHRCFGFNYYLFSLDIRKLKAALATPLDFGDGDNGMDVDTGSEMSAPQASKKVNATSVKNGLSRKWFRNGKFNLANKIRKMYNGYYLVNVGQEIHVWYHRMLQDLNQGTILF